MRHSEGACRKRVLYTKGSDIMEKEDTGMATEEIFNKQI